jgi:hypothetical protein
MPTESPREVDASQRAHQWGRLFVWTTILTVVLAMVLLRRVPSEAELSYAEGVVTEAKMSGGRGRRFTLQIAGRTETFQPRLRVKGAASPPEVVRPGATVRAGHTDETAGMFGFTDNLVVYSLEVDGTPLYTFDQYRSEIADERRRYGAVALGCAGVAAFSFFKWRRWRSRVDATTRGGSPTAR